MLDATDLADMRAVTEESMLDTCQILERLPGDEDGYSSRLDDWRVVETTVCGYRPERSREVMGTTQVTILPAQVRLPLSVDVDTANRVRITKRLGETLAAPEYYTVLGEAQRGPTAQTVSLQTVPDTVVADG